MKNRRGSVLLLTVLIGGLMLALGVFLAKIVYNNYATAGFLADREQAYWLARGGLAAARVALVHDPSWYTDLPHYPEDDPDWLKRTSRGATALLGEGNYKLVRVIGSGRYFAVGLKGKAVVILEGAIR